MVTLKAIFPESFFDEETRNGYFVSKEIKEIWAVEIDLYLELLRVCKKHGIKVFADGGTLIGAIRHEGFIPWDDDIDLSISRDDYEKLCMVASNEFNEPYFFQNECTDPGSVRGHAQLRNSNTCAILKSEKDIGYRFNQGIFIDIFPIDTVPEEKEEREHLIKRVERLRQKSISYSKLFWGERPGVGYRRFVAAILQKIISFFSVKYNNRYYRKMEQLKLMYASVDSPLCSNLYRLLNNNPEKLVWRKEWFDESIEWPFEFISVYVPVGYREYLQHTYGDWEKFVVSDSTHGSILFDTDRSYTEYL